MRIVYSVIAIAVLMVLFCIIMAAAGSDATLLHIAGGIASAVFLGSLGVFALALSNSIAVSYMIPMIYYAIDFWEERLLVISICFPE